MDPREITSPDQITAQLALLTRREADLTLALNALISDRGTVDNALLHLGELTHEVDALSTQVDGGGPSGPSSLGVAMSPSPARQPSPYIGAAPNRGLAALGFVPEDEGLVSRVNRVWETSERVGGKVRKLDDEIGRVREAADVVTEVLELKVRHAGRVRALATRDTTVGMLCS
jgi:hypothetical protein